MKQQAHIARLSYPPATQIDHRDILHGVEVPDPYRWLEDLGSEQTRAWIEAQNRLMADYLADIPEREPIRKRLTDLWNYEKYGVPFERGGRYFFTCNDGLRNQAVLYWMEHLADDPKVLLDPNLLSEDGTVALMSYAVSEDGGTLAYALAASGSDWVEWHLREVESGHDLTDCIEWSKFSGASWMPDGSGFFYSRYDAPAEGQTYKGANYYHKLYFHRVGTPQEADELVYERPDQKEWGFGGTVSEDGQYLIITVWKGSHRENGVFYKDLHAGDGRVVELLNSFDASYDYIDNDGPVLYFVTDNAAPMSRVVAIDTRRPEPSNWQEIIPESSDALQSVELIGDRFVALYLHDAYSALRVLDKRGHLIGNVDLPGLGMIAGWSGRRKDHAIFYLYTSFTTPGTVYRYDIETGATTVFREPRLNFDPAEYTTEQVFYESKDGTRVPMFISHRRGVTPSEETGTYLYGYGGFNIPLTPAFSPGNLVWIEMGGIFAQANLRGGGEYGKSWHEGGMKLSKQSVFDDFIAAAEWLIEHKYTSTPKLAIGGGSNGGLLVGACMTQRPELFGACVPSVGVLDMLRFHKWTIGWAWVSDYGSPDDPQEFPALLVYSPYHNVKPGTAYPATMIVTGDHDDRVFPAHSFKFAAVLQHAQAGSAPILCRIETKAGHGVGKPTSKLIEERTDIWSFLVRELGLEPALSV